jgi:hypothetical protein
MICNNIHLIMWFYDFFPGIDFSINDAVAIIENKLERK